MVKEINNKNEFVEASTKVSLIDCYATWCGPCKMLAPIIEQISEEENNISFYKLDVDKLPDIASMFQIFSIPTLLIFKDNKLVNKLVGYRDYKSLKEILKTVI